MSRATTEKNRVPSKVTQQRTALIHPVALASRVENALVPLIPAQKRMFGGVTFLVNGNMLCCASKSGLMVRVGAAAEEEALASPFARPCMGAGRRMAGFIMVEPDGISSAADLKRWLAMARRYVEALPQKEPKPARTAK
ncbi:MAG: TfoX/Sxy family protein [Bryobacteraceae bacterium]